MAPLPGTLIGKYRLERPVASGGMGSVWSARHTELDVEVAIKFMLASQDAAPGAEARFKREARAAAQLKSPHIVQVHDYGVHDGAPYMVMELLDGEDLGDRIAREGRLAPAEVAGLLAEIAKGLGVAHAAGIVHRDLKPSNVFLAQVGGDTVAKILDFGIAKISATPAITEQTSTGVVLGSPFYMSPEQARGAPVDRRSDLWSLGVLAFEAVTGALPFPGQYLGELIAKICTEPPRSAVSLAPALGPAFDDFFARALARSPGDRFASARELAEAFAALARAHELSPRADSAPEPEPERPASLERSSGRTLAGVGPARTAADPPPTVVAPLGPSASARHRARTRRLRWLSASAAAIGAVTLAVVAWPDAAGAPTAEPPARVAADEARPSGAHVERDEPAVRPGAADPPGNDAAPSAVEASAARAAPARAASSSSSRPRAAPSASSPRRAAPAPSVDPVFGLPVSKP
jgi:serine/threonine-protein kinase